MTFNHYATRLSSLTHDMQSLKYGPSVSTWDSVPFLSSRRNVQSAPCIIRHRLMILGSVLCSVAWMLFYKKWSWLYVYELNEPVRIHKGNVALMTILLLAGAFSIYSKVRS